MSYELLQVIWFALWGLLWAIYFGLDGFDLGSGMLAGVFREDEEQRHLIGSLAPIWDGNEVWVITAGGVTFAAFPKLYATMFSSLYLPLFIILFGLMFRAAAIEFYHHMDFDKGWQRIWGWVLAVGSFLVAFLFGVAFGNIFQGMLLDAQGYHGTIVSLLNPYGLLTGVLFVVAFLMNGASWLAHKAPNDELRAKADTFAKRIWPVVLVVAAGWLVYTPFATNLMQNYLKAPVLFLVPALAVVLLVLTRVYMQKGQHVFSLLMGSLTVGITVIAGVIGLFPNMFPSKIDPAYSLTAFNSSSSHYTLQFMFIVVLIFLPFVLLYQVWAYKLFGRAGTGSEAEHY